MERSFVRRRAGWGMMLLAASIAGCGDDPTGPSATGAINVQDFVFNPTAVVVAAGGTVTFTWTGSNNHTVNFADAALTDSPQQASGTYQITMPSAPGTYTFVCANHPVQMQGSIQVQ